MAKLTRDDALNWWLQKYHNLTVSDVINQLTLEQQNSPTWFELYPVTKEQHDEWYNWIIETLAKEQRTSKKAMRHRFSLDYLDCSPYYKERIDNDN